VIQRGVLSKTSKRSLLIWATAGRGQESTIGPASAFRLVGPSMRTDRDDHEAAAYQQGAWYCPTSNRSFGVLWSEYDAVLRFEDPTTGHSAPLGPFDMIGLVDNMLYVNREHSKAAAKLDERTRKWCAIDTGIWWPQIVISPAPPPAFRLEHIWPTFEG